jgi:hypothetical protein
MMAFHESCSSVILHSADLCSSCIPVHFRTLRFIARDIGKAITFYAKDAGLLPGWLIFWEWKLYSEKHQEALFDLNNHTPIEIGHHI